MLRLARWHIWLGWLAGVPLVLWTLSGLFMSARPIDEVRGSQLRHEVPAIASEALIFPRVTDELRGAELVQQPIGPVWILTETDGRKLRYYAPDGSLLPPVIESEARDIAAASFAGTAKLESVTFFPADIEPLDLRAGRPSWQAHYDDGTNLYIDGVTGQVLAIRTGWWRAYDFMWGLHIMDLQTREDTSHPILILFAVIALISSIIGTALLFRRRKARVAA